MGALTTISNKEGLTANEIMNQQYEQMMIQMVQINMSILQTRT